MSRRYVFNFAISAVNAVNFPLNINLPQIYNFLLICLRKKGFAASVGYSKSELLLQSKQGIR